MISRLQIKAARALLEWSQEELADRALISINALRLLERGKVDPRVSTVEGVERAFRAAGIEFIPEDGKRGEGVRLSSPRG